MSRKIHGRIPKVIEGESPEDRSSRLAAFTQEFWDKMQKRVENGQAKNMAFVHEEGYVLAVTEGEKEPEQAPQIISCEYCGENCEKETIYDELAELAEELGENENITNKERRFALYREANRLLQSGGRGKGNRVRIPTCVMTEIRDFFPIEGDKKYVGFKDN